MKNTAKTPRAVIDYGYLASAIANAALSRRAALQIELAVSLIHFTQETNGTDTTGKANLKAIYHAAGYLCMAKADRDYKTVNRRLNAMAKVFDKLGSRVVNGWVSDKGDTESTVNYVLTELTAYGFDTLDDVLAYVDVQTNRTRPARQPAAPVAVTVPAKEEAEGKGEEEAPKEFDQDAAYAAIIANMDADAIRTFCTRLLIKVAELEETPELKAA